MKMEQTECSETSTYKIQTSGNYPEENIELVHLLVVFYGVTTVCIQVLVLVSISISKSVV